MKVRLLSTFIAAALLWPVMASGQARTPEQMEKEFYEAIQNEVDKETVSLDLDYWQVFKVDSMLTHDYKAMQEEIAALRKSKVSNSDLYFRVQDKWAEQIYQSYRTFLSDEQWARYLKKGAAKEKKARDKRAAK